VSRRFLTVIAVAAASAGIAATSAQAGVTAAAQVTSASRIGSCTAGLVTWQINMTLVVQNTDATPVTLASAAYEVNATSTALGGPLPYAAVVTADGGLPGTTVDLNATVTIPGIVLTTNIPCDTTSAQVCVIVSVLDGTQTPQSCADFIAGGTAVPMGTVGLLGLTAVLGAGLLFAQFRAQRKRREAGRRTQRR
jgi:hypothetical protein